MAYLGEYTILKDGILITATQMEWAMWFTEGKRVDSFRADGIDISTVCLGLNHGTRETPLYFETWMTGELVREISYNDIEVMLRYETLEEAKKSHQDLINKYLKHTKVVYSKPRLDCIDEDS